MGRARRSKRPLSQHSLTYNSADDPKIRPVLSWLGCEYNAEQRGYFNRSIPGTGEWFLKSQEYMDWRYRTEGMTAVLFCFGSPGVGKSTLASMVIRSLQDEYREERNVGVAYVYFDYTRQREQTPEHLVGSLLRQLVQKLWETNRLLPDSVKSFFEKYTQSGRYPSLAEFSQVLLSVIDVYSDVFVVVDALDECLEDHLADFMSVLGIMPLRLLITSRDSERQAFNTLRCIKSMTCITISSPPHDTQTYLKARLRGGHDSIKGIIRSNLVRGSGESFLWVKLIVDILTYQISEKAIHPILEALCTLSHDLEQTYMLFMLVISGRGDHFSQIVRKFFAWVIFSKGQLIQSDLQKALEIDRNILLLSQQEPHITDIGTIISSYSSLLIANDGYIRFHHSAHQFFEKNADALFPDARADIARECISYLSRRTFDSGSCAVDSPSEIERRSDALYVFAARNWGFYARHSSDGEELVLEFLRNRMTVTACVQAILAQLNFEGTYREDAADSVSGLHLATYFGLHKSINILIEEGAELDQRDCHGSTPLSWAAKFGDEAAVKLLISSGATLDTQNQDGLTPLCLAAASGYKTVVMLLLDANADPLGGSKDKKPLLLAEENKHDEVAALISEYAHEVARREMDASDTLPDISEVSSICSEGSMTSDQSSADRRDELSKKACYIVGEIFCTDPRLRELYQEALKKFSKKKFAKLHDNILKEFFKALNVEVRRALPKAPGLQVIKVLQRSVERGLVTDSIYDICNPSENTMWNSGVSMLNAHALNDHDESNVKSMILQDPVSFKSFVTRRESFGQFKASIHALVRPTTAIPAALQFNHGNLLQRLLSKHLDQVAVGEYFWITELAEAGYSAAEIAEILIQGTTDTPWIYFEPRSQDSPKVFPRDDFHAPGCVHHCFDCLTDVEHAHRDQDSPGVDMNLDEIQELCGLAGITPSSRDPDSWNGVVTFRDENTVAMVSYGFESLKRNRNHEILRRNTTILSRLCSAAGRMQSSSLCCDAFTVLTRPIQVLDAEAAPVNLCRVEFRLMMRLLDTLKGLSVSDLATRSRSADLQKSILEIFDGIEPNIFNNEKMESSIDETLNALSLTVQFLSIGFLSYNQGHVGPIQPFFLDTPQRKIILTGSKQPGNRCITIGLTNLTCLGNMIGGAVLVFRLQQSSVGGLDLCFENEGTFDVFATAQDVLDTWGPGSFVVQTNEGLRPAPCAIKLRGGLIYPLVGENNNLFHWSDMVDIDSLRLSPFDPRSKIRIGSPVEVNLTCALDENECWQKSLCAFSSLDVHRHYWKHVETQIGGQAGNYILLQTNWTKHKIPGKTFKQEILEQEPKMLVRYLNCLCGLQVSFCTGVARRVTLRELIRDVFPIFADILITENAIRDELENQYNILEAFRTDTVQESLKRLPKQLYELMLSIIWSIVSCLRSTGIDPEGKFLSVAWLYAQDDGPIQCLRIPCSDKKNSWVHVLADAEDCATFAYISTDCLVTPEVQCRGPSPLWHNTTPLLETAVLQHNENPSQPLSQLENSRVYFFKKMDTLLKVNVNRRTPTSIVTLFVGQSSIPAKFTRRLYVMERHRWIRIRERQRSSEDGVEQVTVLAKDDKGLPSLLRSRSSTSTIQSPNNSGVPPVDPVSKDSS